MSSRTLRQAARHLEEQAEALHSEAMRIAIDGRATRKTHDLLDATGLAILALADELGIELSFDELDDDDNGITDDAGDE